MASSSNFQKIQNSGLSGLGLAHSVASLINDKLSLIVVPSVTDAYQMQNELSFFGQSTEIFADRETLPYDCFSPHQDLISKRIEILARLLQKEKLNIIVAIPTLLQKLSNIEFINEQCFIVDFNEEYKIKDLTDKLVKNGYYSQSRVEEHGQFAVRGSILDVYPMGAKTPFRIDFFDNSVDSIRSFDPKTQRTLNKVSEIKILAAREYPFNEEAIINFRNNFREEFSGCPTDIAFYNDVSNQIPFAGIEYYIPLFSDTSCLLDYLPNHQIIMVNDIHSAANDAIEFAKNRYEQYRHDISRPILAPEKIFFNVSDIFAKFKQMPGAICSTKNENSAYLPTPNISIDNKSDFPLKRFIEFINSQKYRTLILAESAGRRVVIEELLTKYRLASTLYPSFEDFISDSARLGIIVAPLSQGVILEDCKVAIFSENCLFGRRVMQSRRRKSKVEVADNMVSNLAELTIGSAVVHIEHGVGRYQGLATLTINNEPAEFVELHFANQNKLYVPVANLHLLSRYSAHNKDNVPLHTLGSQKWQQERKAALFKVRDTAAELLAVYAKRASKAGSKYTLPEDYEQFTSDFIFEETEDQIAAINAVLSDLQKENPMDRVICGDVGFGKTEVAMRAAFIVASNNKQVAVLVPTTLLANQHYSSFCDRFANFPISIDVLSRFKSKKEQDIVLEKVKSGKVDIIIGTHKLIQEGIEFKDLGLLIIDEEHRFGVRQKDKFKQLRSEVDILNLTATPIPRTLNMSLAGVRDLSIIATPPRQRLAVRTFVQEYSTPVIVDAINRELQRGGQVYFLHNSVDTIMQRSHELQELNPTARIAVAHGQMHERELEQITADFYHGRYNVLVCTTIIETGIDIPLANTIIIERSDKLGLAQLHQLRGRVGRSHHQAYAFLLTPHPKSISKDAKKRLDAIANTNTLGAGFTLATHDMEIRGAGELLGDDQSGHMQSLGFSLYLELLDKAVKMLERGEQITLDDIKPDNQDIDLSVPALIPDEYISCVQTRLVLYKRISNINSITALQEIKVEVIDRFGILPLQLKVMFIIVELRIKSKEIGISAIKAHTAGGRIDFNANPNIDSGKIIKLVQESPNIYAFSPPNGITFNKTLDNHEKRIEFVKDLVNKLSN